MAKILVVILTYRKAYNEGAVQNTYLWQWRSRFQIVSKTILTFEYKVDFQMVLHEPLSETKNQLFGFDPKKCYCSNFFFDFPLQCSKIGQLHLNFKNNYIIKIGKSTANVIRLEISNNDLDGK